MSAFLSAAALLAVFGWLCGRLGFGGKVIGSFFSAVAAIALFIFAVWMLVLRPIFGG